MENLPPAENIGDWAILMAAEEDARQGLAPQNAQQAALQDVRQGLAPQNAQQAALQDVRQGLAPQNAQQPALQVARQGLPPLNVRHGNAQQEMTEAQQDFDRKKALTQQHFAAQSQAGQSVMDAQQALEQQGLSTAQRDAAQQQLTAAQQDLAYRIRLAEEHFAAQQQARQRLVAAQQAVYDLQAEAFQNDFYRQYALNNLASELQRQHHVASQQAQQIRALEPTNATPQPTSMPPAATTTAFYTNRMGQQVAVQFPVFEEGSSNDLVPLPSSNQRIPPVLQSGSAVENNGQRQNGLARRNEERNLADLDNGSSGMSVDQSPPRAHHPADSKNFGEDISMMHDNGSRRPSPSRRRNPTVNVPYLVDYPEDDERISGSTIRFAQSVSRRGFHQSVPGVFHRSTPHIQPLPSTAPVRRQHPSVRSDTQDDYHSHNFQERQQIALQQTGEMPVNFGASHGGQFVQSFGGNASRLEPVNYGINSCQATGSISKFNASNVNWDALYARRSFVHEEDRIIEIYMNNDAARVVFQSGLSLFPSNRDLLEIIRTSRPAEGLYIRLYVHREDAFAPNDVWRNFLQSVKRSAGIEGTFTPLLLNTLLRMLVNIQELYLYRIRLEGRLADYVRSIIPNLQHILIDTRTYDTSIFMHAIKFITRRYWPEGAPLPYHRPRTITLLVTDFPRPGAFDSYFNITPMFVMERLTILVNLQPDNAYKSIIDFHHFTPVSLTHYQAENELYAIYERRVTIEDGNGRQLSAVCQIGFLYPQT